MYEESEDVKEVQQPENDELFFAQFLQPDDSPNNDQILKEEPVLVYQQEDEYESMEVLAEEGSVEVPEEYFEEVPLDEVEAYCRLCGRICPDLESFAENELIQQMLNKCFPSTTIQPGDGLSSDICGTCLTTVQSFSQFSDDVLSIQKQLEEKFLTGEGVIQEDECKEEEMMALTDGSNDNFQE